MVVGIDSSVLLSYYQTRYGGAGFAGLSGGSTAAARKYAPTAPWDTSIKPTPESTLTQSALRGAPFINEGAAKLDLAGASADYKKLFALYQGVNTLYSLADQASAPGVSPSQLKQLQAAFIRGQTEIANYVSTLKFDQLRLTEGTLSTSDTSKTGVQTQATQYVTSALNASGNSAALVPAFKGAVQFDISITRASGSVADIPIDFSEMGATPRTMSNVLAYINGKLADAGVGTTFASQRIAATPQTITTGSTSFTLPPGPDQWSLKINTNSVETVTLSAPPVADAVYIGAMVGDLKATPPSGSTATAAGGDASNDLMKFQAGGTAPPPLPNQPYYVNGRLFSNSLSGSIASIGATATAADGSVFVLANVTSNPNGQVISGSQDVALIKYDSAGHVLYSTDLGAATSASGLALAVSVDGKVAIAGSVNGSLTSGDGVTDASQSDTFVSVYNSDGAELWTQRRGASADDKATSVAFGDDGSVYVAGQTQSAIPGSAGALGGADAYLQAFSSTGAFESATQYGTSGSDGAAGVAFDGSDLYVASVESGHAVVRQYDVTDPSSPVLTASRDLGDLQGGTIAGIQVQNGQVFIAGSSGNSALNAGTITNAASGGVDAFAATLSPGLAPLSSDAIAYYGGTGDDHVTGMTVSGGKVWLTGSAGADLPGLASVGTQDGFAAELNVSTGQVDWSTRFSGQDGRAAPTTIAVSQGGASILDQLGLPQGVVDGPVPDLLTEQTSLKVGDQFTIQSGLGASATITIAADDTLASLATKIGRATGFQVSASTQTVGTSTKLVIKPINARSVVTLVSGPAGRDALAGLGLTAGVMRTTTANAKGVSVPADGKSQIYGLAIAQGLDLNSASDISHAKNALTAALSVIKGAYQALKSAATPASVAAAAAAASGPVPTYLTNQIANYQSALARLTGATS